MFLTPCAGDIDNDGQNDAIVDVQGQDSAKFLSYLLANDVAKLKADGKALYTAMLNEQGGIIDDLIVYKMHDSNFRLVLNAATKEKDLAWLRQHINSYQAQLIEHPELVNLAVQGPNARTKVAEVLPENLRAAVLALKPFSCVIKGDWQVSRTGYTGEDGFEILLPVSQAAKFWQALLAVGIKPCGLGARDTLRLEAGLNLYGADMDETVSPLESNITWTVAFEPVDRDFIGRAALEVQRRQGNYPQLVGLLLADKGVLRAGQKVFQNDQAVGVVISGTFSPTLKQSIAFARVLVKGDEDCQVEIRDKRLNAHLVKLPFVRNGKAVFKLMKEVEGNE